MRTGALTTCGSIVVGCGLLAAVGYLIVVNTAGFISMEATAIYASAAKVSEMETPEGDSQEVLAPPCPDHIRQKLLQRACAKYKPITTQETMPGVSLDRENGVVFCHINKAGSISVGRFFAHLRGLDKPQRLKYHQLKGSSAKYAVVLWMPFSDVLSKYNDFTKLFMVRHPLQRVVSAYHELSHHKVVEKWDNFTHFLRRSLFNSSRPVDEHWLEFYQHCHPCETNYDLILKTETSSLDTRRLITILQANPNVTMEKHHVRNSRDAVEDPFKYDEYLRQLERDSPNLFKQLLQKYAIDMDMFGYTWRDHRSRCENDLEQCC